MPSNNSIHEPTDRFYYDNYFFETHDNVFVDKIYFDYKSTNINNTYNLLYLFENSLNKYDSLTYIINNDTIVELNSVNNYKKKNVYILDSMNTFILNNKSYLISRYLLDSYAIDGGKHYFWTPEYGIIIKRSPTWGHFSKLQSENDSINQILNRLFDSIAADMYFFLGASIIPKEDEEDFINMKVEKLKHTMPNNANGS